jgi:hypothetical protein
MEVILLDAEYTASTANGLASETGLLVPGLALSAFFAGGRAIEV